MSLLISRKLYKSRCLSKSIAELSSVFIYLLHFHDSFFRLRGGLGSCVRRSQQLITDPSLHIWSKCVQIGTLLRPAQFVADLRKITMTSFILFLWILSAAPVLSVRVLAGPGCASCDPSQCASLPVEGCPSGSLLDSCACCSVCAASEGQTCGGRRADARRCGAGMECVKGDAHKKNKLGVCVCKSNYEVCGTDGVTHSSGCALKSASLTAEKEGKEPISVQNKGRCSTGETHTHKHTHTGESQ